MFNRGDEMADDTNKYLLSIVAVVALTGLFLLFMQENNVPGTETATGLAVGYSPEFGEIPTFDENGNKICTGRVRGDKIIPDYIDGCQGSHLKIRDWNNLPPAVKAYYNKKRVAYRQVAHGNPAYDWPEGSKNTLRTIKADVKTGGSGLPDKPPANEAEVVEVLGVPELGRSVSTLV
jgi:hypothetical protein